MKKRCPEWTPEEISKVRRVARSGGTIKDAIAAINSPLSCSGARGRCKMYGIVFSDRRGQHYYDWEKDDEQEDEQVRVQPRLCGG